MRTQPLEVSALRFFKSLPASHGLLAVSGGADSMALFKIIDSLKEKLPQRWSVVHIHHGATSDSDLRRFRDRAWELVRERSSEAGFEFLSNVKTIEEAARIELTGSEAAYRKYRRDFLRQTMESTGASFVVTAHHREDLLETRLLRMIRGTGPQGLRSMSEMQGTILRPFLRFSSRDLKAYLKYRRFSFLEDPTNRDARYLRNWIRTRWLPALEGRRPGSTERLSLSLESLVAGLEKSPSLDHCYENGRILRSEFVSLENFDKRRVLAGYFKQQGLQNYGLSHLNELTKRLDVERKDLTFRMLKKIWLANARHIWCE